MRRLTEDAHGSRSSGLSPAIIDNSRNLRDHLSARPFSPALPIRSGSCSRPAVPPHSSWGPGWLSRAYWMKAAQFALLASGFGLLAGGEWHTPAW
jgi:hypothetical protein